MSFLQFSLSANSDPTNEAKVQTTLRLVLTELQQLITGFGHCYELEVRPWCNKVRPHLTQLGASFQRVHGLLQGFTQVTGYNTNENLQCDDVHKNWWRIHLSMFSHVTSLYYHLLQVVFTRPEVLDLRCSVYCSILLNRSYFHL